tara:strand:+ start:1957 stop:3252 length:1296 start_codon:yes stop_codon:yes gene_type:complete
MESKVDLDNQSFFGKGVEFWLGMIVKFDKQKSQTSGMGWGWRYKVRIIGDYSNSDSVDDKDVHTALALIPTTGGTGGAGKKGTVKLTQGDVVFGAFLSPNNNFPVILGALGRTKESAEKAKENDNSKLAPKSGFTPEQKAGLTQDQEYSGQDQIVTPRIREGTEKGNGKSKASPTEKLSDVKGGNDPNENAVDAVYQPKLDTAKKGKDLYEQPVVDDPTQDIRSDKTNASVLNARYNARTNADIKNLESQMNRRSTSKEEKERIKGYVDTLKKDQLKVNDDFSKSQSTSNKVSNVTSPITSSEKSEVINKINKKNNINNAKEVLDGSAPADDKEVLKLQYDYAKEVENVQVKKATNESTADIRLYPTNTGNLRRDEFNKRKNSLLLMNRYGGTGAPITIGDKTYQPWDAGYRDAVNTATVIPSSDEAFNMF